MKKIFLILFIGFVWCEALANSLNNQFGQSLGLANSIRGDVKLSDSENAYLKNTSDDFSLVNKNTDLAMTIAPENKEMFLLDGVSLGLGIIGTRYLGKQMLFNDIVKTESPDANGKYEVDGELYTKQEMLNKAKFYGNLYDGLKVVETGIDVVDTGVDVVATVGTLGIGAGVAVATEATKIKAKIELKKAAKKRVLKQLAERKSKKTLKQTPKKTPQKVVKNSGRGKNNMKPDPKAEGSHTVVKKNDKGEITGYIRLVS